MVSYEGFMVEIFTDCDLLSLNILTMIIQAGARGGIKYSWIQF